MKTSDNKSCVKQESSRQMTGSRGQTPTPPPGLYTYNLLTPSPRAQQKYDTLPLAPNLSWRKVL